MFPRKLPRTPPAQCPLQSLRPESLAQGSQDGPLDAKLRGDFGILSLASYKCIPFNKLLYNPNTPPPTVLGSLTNDKEQINTEIKSYAQAFPSTAYNKENGTAPVPASWEPDVTCTSLD